MKKYDVYFVERYWQGFIFETDEVKNGIKLSGEEIVYDIVDEAESKDESAVITAKEMQYDSFDEAEKAVNAFMQNAKSDIRNITTKNGKVTFEGFIDFAIIETNEYEELVDEDDNSIYLDYIDGLDSKYYAKPLTLSYK